MLREVSGDEVVLDGRLVAGACGLGDEEAEGY